MVLRMTRKKAKITALDDLSHFSFRKIDTQIQNFIWEISGACCTLECGLE